MTQRTGTKQPSDYVTQIREVLSSYAKAHPTAKIDVKRQKSVSIRIRIVDPDFRGEDHVDRDSRLWKILRRLPDDVQSQITVLLLLTPDELAVSFANFDFENPIASKF